MYFDYSPPFQDKHWLLRQPANPMKSSSLDFLDNAYKKRYNCRTFICCFLRSDFGSDCRFLPLGLSSVSAAAPLLLSSLVLLWVISQVLGVQILNKDLLQAYHFPTKGLVCTQTVSAAVGYMLEL